MNGNHCRLYDEELVKNIMLSTGLSVADFVRKRDIVATPEALCRFIESNADSIIENTLDELTRDDTPPPPNETS